MLLRNIFKRKSHNLDSPKQNKMNLPQGVLPKPVPDIVKSLTWLLGSWRCENLGQGNFPTIQDFKYGEEINFSNVGQPMLNYSSFTWHPELKFPMHQENGFLRIKPGTDEVSLVLSHNFGITSIEEGKNEEGKSLKLKSKEIARMSFAKEPSVTQLEREFVLLDEKTLKQTVFMATRNTPLTKHLEATYKKVE